MCTLVHPSFCLPNFKLSAFCPRYLRNLAGTIKRTPSSPSTWPLPCRRPSPHTATLTLKTLNVPARLCTGLEIGSPIGPTVHCYCCTWLHCSGYRTHWYIICGTFLGTFACFALASGWESERISLNNAYIFQNVYCYVTDSKAR